MSDSSPKKITISSKSSRKPNKNIIDRLEKTININFKNRNLIIQALTHRSYDNEAEFSRGDNERLEYLGDSVLALVVNEYLYKNYPDYREGKLAKIKSVAVSEVTLAKMSRKIDLGRYIFMGKGEENNGGRERSSILANTFESVVGAIYLDYGLKMASGFILSYIVPHIESIDKENYFRDPKTTLQEYVQKKFKKRPEYSIVSEDGPDHDKIFVVQVFVNGKKLAVGTGSSKRKGEMAAAVNALKQMSYKDLG